MLLDSGATNSSSVTNPYSQPFSTSGYLPTFTSENGSQTQSKGKGTVNPLPYFSHANFKPFFQAFQTSLHLYAQYELQVQHHILSSDTSESTDRGIRTMKIKNTQKE